MSNGNAHRLPSAEPCEPRDYQPPVGDEPLDRVQQALVNAYVDILAAEIEECGGLLAWLHRREAARASDTAADSGARARRRA